MDQALVRLSYLRMFTRTSVHFRLNNVGPGYVFAFLAETHRPDEIARVRSWEIAGETGDFPRVDSAAPGTRLISTRSDSPRQFINNLCLFPPSSLSFSLSLFVCLSLHVRKESGWLIFPVIRNSVSISRSALISRLLCPVFPLWKPLVESLKCYNREETRS